jgi:hypothetical protein
MQQYRLVTPEEVRSAFRQLARQDREANLEKALREAFADELKPVNQNGRWNPSSLLVLLVCLVLAVAGVFFYFTFARPPL